MRKYAICFMVMWWCYPIVSERWRVEELHGDPTAGPRSEVENGFYRSTVLSNISLHYEIFQSICGTNDNEE